MKDDESKQVGSHTTFGPHRMKRDVTRLPCADFCGRCHTETMKEYEQLYAPSRLSRPLATCADCHMPRYTSRLTQGHLLSLIHPKRAVPNHSFSAAVTAGAKKAVSIIDLQVERVDEGSWLVKTTILNRGAGHRIPTGKFGHNEVRILAEVLDAENRVVAQAEESLYARSETSLAPGRPTRFTLGPVAKGSGLERRLRLSVERVNEDRTIRFLLGQRQLPLPVSDP